MFSTRPADSSVTLVSARDIRPEQQDLNLARPFPTRLADFDPLQAKPLLKILLAEKCYWRVNHLRPRPPEF